MGKGRKAKKARKEEEEVFHVEVVTKAHVVAADSDDEGKPSGWEYYVKWSGYDSDANTWEPSENLQGCQRLLDSFWSHVGLDDNDYPLGYEVTASKNWIQKEKDFFAKNYKATQAEKKRQEDEEKSREKEKEKEKSNKLKKRKASTSLERSLSKEAFTTKRQKTPKRVNTAEPSSSEDDTPLRDIQRKSSFSITLPPSSNKRKVVVSSSSSDEEPLQQSQKSRPKKIHKTTEDQFSTEDNIEIPSPREGSPTSLFSRSPTPEVPLAEKVLLKNKGKMIAPPSKPMRQPTNPQAKIARIPPSEIPSSSGISTKQRLSLGALAPTLPKDLLNKPKLPPKPLPGRSGGPTLMGLSFKKKTGPQLTIRTSSLGNLDDPLTSAHRSPVQEHEPTLASLNSPSHQSPHIITDSPLSMTPSTSFQALRQNIASKRLSLSEPTIAPAMITQPLMAEAEELLQSMMPPELAAPIESHVDIDRPTDPLPPKPMRAALPTRNLSKKVQWSWNGPIVLNSSEAALCHVDIQNITQGQGLGFSIVFQAMERIDLSSMYDIADLRGILAIFQKPTQLGSLSPEGDVDKDPFNNLLEYSINAGKAFLVPIILDNNIVGQVLFCAENFHHTLKIELPQELLGTRLIVSVLPYALSQEQLSRQLQTSTFKPSAPVESPPSNVIRDILRTQREYHTAKEALDFPNSLYEYIADQTYKHPYSIWSGGDAKRQNTDTRFLQSILERARGFNAGNRTDARVVFIHAGSLSTVHKLADFVERRANTPYIQFYTYGSDPAVPLSIWTVREIWPCGGIITFSPSVMHKNPMDVRHLIRQISRHPLWACYILPSALGSLAKLECGNEDPVAMFQKGNLMMQIILEAIQDGDIALLHAPPVPSHSNKEKEEQWLANFVSFTPPTQLEALKMGITAFIQASSAGRLIETDLSKDLVAMSFNTAFIYQYRRYVVIQSDGDASRGVLHSDGLEWTTVAKFDFRDEFFPKQSIFNVPPQSH